MNNVETLYCTNPECPAKFMKAFTLFVSRDAMNIDGMSEATLEKFVGHGFIREFADIFRLDRYRDEIVEMDGFGEKSYQNLIDSIERAKNICGPKTALQPLEPQSGFVTSQAIPAAALTVPIPQDLDFQNKLHLYILLFLPFSSPIFVIFTIL